MEGDMRKAPRLEIYFKGSKNSTLCNLRKQRALRDEDVRNTMARLEKQLAVQPHEVALLSAPSLPALESLEPALESLLRFSAAVGPSHLDWEVYSLELLRFYYDYEQYLVAKHAHETLLNRTAVLEFEISNSGAMTATNMNIGMSFPKGVQLFTERNFPLAPVEPEAPQKPLPVYEKLAKGQINLDRPAGVRKWMPDEKIVPVTAFSISHTDRSDVNFQVKELRHLHRIHVGKFYVVFPDMDSAKSFSLQYSAKCEQSDQQSNGALHVQIAKPNESWVA